MKLPNPIDVKDIKEKSLKLLDITLPDKYILFIGRLSWLYESISFIGCV